MNRLDPTLTPQQALNKIVRHLRKQGRKALAMSRVEGVVCAYRGFSKVDDHTTMCAAGCLIPDEHYTPDMENVLVGLLPYFQGHPALNVIRDLQKIHDHYTVDNWESGFSHKANIHGLTLPDQTS